MRSSPIIAVFISPIGCSLVDVIGHCYCLKIWHSHYCWCCNIVWLFIIVGLRICLVFAFYIIHFHVVLWKCIFMLMCRFRNRPCSFHTLASVTVSVVTAFVTHSRKWNRWGDWWTWGGTNGWRQLWGFFHWFPIVGIFHFNKLTSLQEINATKKFAECKCIQLNFSPIWNETTFCHKYYCRSNVWDMNNKLWSGLTRLTLAMETMENILFQVIYRTWETVFHLDI